MDKVVGEFDKCDECESLVDVYVEFHSRRGDLVKICMNCLANAIVRPARRAPDVCPSCAGEKQVIGEDGNVWVCGICGGTGKRR
jgi:ribosomal protein S27AE